MGVNLYKFCRNIADWKKGSKISFSVTSQFHKNPDEAQNPDEVPE